MATFLSDDWVAELADAAASIDPPPELRLAVQQHVVGPDGHTTSYAIQVADGRVAVTPGVVPEADLSLTQDAATAAAIARGELSAQVAFITGRLRVGGDLRRVIDDARPVDAMGDVFAAVRSRTTW